MTDGQFNRGFILMLIAMAVLTVLLMVIAVFASSDVNERLDAQAELENSDAIASRISPVGEFAAQAAAAIPAAQAAEMSGDEVYNNACSACHGAGIAGAPAVGDAAQWSTRLGQGIETVYKHAIEGFQGNAGYMPAKGGNASLSDDDVKKAVDYMLENSK